METKNSQVTISAVADAKYDPRKQPPTATEIQAWIVSYLAQLLEINPDEVDTAIPFDQYGLDSSAAVGMTGDLEDWMEKKSIQPYFNSLL
jgi:acyl carrier protein